MATTGQTRSASSARKPRPPTAAQQAQQIVAPQYAPIDYAIGRAQHQSAAERAALQAATLALVKQLQAGARQAGGAYDAAVQQTQDLAHGAASLLANANPDAQMQAGLASIGAPAEQQQQLSAQNRALFPGAGAVLNVAQGSVPGASLLAQKAAEQGYLSGLPTVAALSGQQSLRGLLARAADTRDKLLEQRLGVSAQIPQLAYNIGQDRLVAQQKADALATEQAYRQAELDQRDRSQASLDAYRQAGLISEAQYRKASLGLRQQEIAIRAASAPSEQTGLTPYQAQTLAERKREFNLRRSGSAGTGLTQTQARSARAKANQLKAKVLEARRGYYAKTPLLKDTLIGGVVHKAGTPLYPNRPTYDAAVKEAERQGIPLEIAVPILNSIFPAQYEVTNRGLRQTGIRGQPSTFAGNPTGRRRRRKK